MATINEKIKQIKRRYGIGLSSSLTQSVEDTSQALNSRLISYEEKINALRSLIEEGGVNIGFAKNLNDSLVKKLKELRSSENDQFLQAPLEILALDASAADKMIEHFKEMLPQMQAEFFPYFEREILKLFTPNAPNSLIRLSKHINSEGDSFSQEDMNYPGLVEQYVENYVNLMQNQAVNWDKSLLIGYIKFLENNIYEPGFDLEDRITTIVRSVICSRVLQFQGQTLNKMTQERIGKAIELVLNELVEDRAKDFVDLVNDYKRRFVEKINELFEKLNLEQFPEAVFEYIETQKQEDQKFYSEIVIHLQEVNDWRINLDERLKERKLYAFSKTERVSMLLASLGYADELKEGITQSRMDQAFTDLFETADSHLAVFMEERNEYGVEIEAYLNADSGLYADLIQKMNSFEFSEEDLKNKVNLAVVNSLESMALELKTAYISSLAVKFREFHGSEISNVRQSFFDKTAKHYLTAEREVLDEVQQESLSLLDAVSTVQTDNLSMMLDDESIKRQVREWVITHRKDKAWKSWGIWKPSPDLVEQMVTDLIQEATDKFVVKKQELLEKRVQRIESSNTLRSITQKICNIFADGFKVAAIVKTAGAAIPLFLSNQENEVGQCENTVYSLIAELESKLKSEEVQKIKEDFAEKMMEGSSEAVSKFVEEVEKAHGIKFVHKELVSKINERYNPFNNEKLFMSTLEKEIIKVRNEVNHEIQRELLSTVSSRKQELQVYLSEEDLANKILNESV